jgi:hypothetical protein
MFHGYRLDDRLGQHEREALRVRPQPGEDLLQVVQRRLVRIGLAAVIVGALAACTPSEEASAGDLVGLTLAEAQSLLPEDPIYLVQDASPLVGRVPTYSSFDFTSSRWMIIAACADREPLASASTIEIAVIPEGDPLVSPSTKERDFAHAVTCDFSKETSGSAP